MMVPSTVAARCLHRLGVPIATALFASHGTDASAQSRWVVVNGQRLHDAQVAELARRNCADIPNGAYWLNTRSGAWGYAGNAQVQGVFGEGCGNGGSAEGRHGPYARIGRAQEVAYGFRAKGYRAVAFHSGDGYCVDVER